MEKLFNRKCFLKELPKFINNLELSEKFLGDLKRHQYFVDHQELLNGLKGESLKLFILLELTKERSTCAAIVNLLQESNQNGLADRLNQFNQSLGPWFLNTEVQIDVLKGGAPILGRSNTYTLHGYPRGKCIIINNVEDQQMPDVYDKYGNHLFSPKGLKRETIRFEDVFTQLHFDVKVITNLSAKQMSEQLTQLSKQNLSKDEAFVLIVISHGQDKKVLGYDACEAMRKIAFKEIKTESDRVEAEQDIEKDFVPINNLVKIFADEKCPQLSLKPKLFFFVCCRNIDGSNKDGESYKDVTMSPSEFDTVKNLDTFVSYASAEGCESIYNLEWGMSYFGVALTQSIAQYACEEPLSVIMARTSSRLKKMFDDIKEEQNKTNKERADTKQINLNIGNFAIQVNTYAMDRQLYFNPGFDDRKSL